VQWNGRYVIAPPTEGYTVVDNGCTKPRRLSRAEYHALIRYFRSEHTSAFERNAAETPGELLPIITVRTIIDYYKRIKDQMGRNNALFHVCRFARDNGILSEDLLRGGLQEAFVYSQHPSGKNESKNRRVKEYTRTVASVYSRYPHLQHSRKNLVHREMSDSARQILHEQGRASVARGLDGILLHFEPGSPVTRKEVYQSLRGIMDWKKLNRTLNAEFNGQKFFKKLVSSPHPSSGEANADSMRQNNAYSGQKKTEKSKIGRPPEIFVVPSAEKIQQITRAQYWTTTLIRNEDLKSIRRYRARLNTGRIEQTQHYKFHSQKWLATCLGVTTRTIYSYIELEQLHKQERFIFVETITGQNVASLKYRQYSGAHLLFTGSGRRYPVDYRIARALLNQRHSLMIRRQGSNYYSTRNPGMKTQELQQKQFSADWDELITQYQTGQLSGAIRKEEKQNPEFVARSKVYFQQLRDQQTTIAPDQEDKLLEESEEERLKRLYLDARADIQQLQSIDIPDDERYVREVFAAMPFVYMAATMQQSGHRWIGLEGIPEPSEKTIDRRKLQRAEEPAKTLTMLLPPVNGNVFCTMTLPAN